MSGRSFQLDSHPARRELILPLSRRTRVETLPPVLLGFPQSCRCCSARQRLLLPLSGRISLPPYVFIRSFPLHPAGLLGVRCRLSPSGSGRDGRAAGAPRGALGLCQRSPLAPRPLPSFPKPASPSHPTSEKGSSKPLRSPSPLFIFLISLLFPAPPFLPSKLGGRRPGRGDPGRCGGAGAAYQGVDGGAGSQAVGAGGAVAAAVGPCPWEQAGAEGQQRAAESQEQRHGAARRTGQPAAATSRSHPWHGLQTRSRKRRRERIQTNSAKLTLFRGGNRAYEVDGSFN